MKTSRYYAEMSRRAARSGRPDLTPLPDDRAILTAVQAAEEDPRSRRGITSNMVAQHAGIVGARRLGNGAVKGSWSGRMSPALRVAPRLAALARKGLLYKHYDTEQHRWCYGITNAGREMIGVEIEYRTGKDGRPYRPMVK